MVEHEKDDFDPTLSAEKSHECVVIILYGLITLNETMTILTVVDTNSSKRRYLDEFEILN